MIIYSRKKGYRKGNQSNIPNVLAFTMIRSFLNDKSYKKKKISNQPVLKKLTKPQQ